MDFNIEVRKKQLESIDQYITSARDKVQSILDCLGWTIENTLKETPMVHCPNDPGHRFPKDHMNEHIEKCNIKCLNYDLKNEFLSEPPNNSESTIKLDLYKKIEILTKAHSEVPYFRTVDCYIPYTWITNFFKVKTSWNGQDPDPCTSDRLISTFSPDERLALYDYSIKNTRGPPAPPEFDTSVIEKLEAETQYKTSEDILSYHRDLKRRRIKYKTVHTNKRNYKDVLQKVIDGQMEQFKDWLSYKEQLICDSENKISTEDSQQNDCNNSIDLNILSQDTIDRVNERPSSSFSKNSSHSTNSKCRLEHSRTKSNSYKESEYQCKDQNYESKSDSIRTLKSRSSSRQRKRVHSRERSNDYSVERFRERRKRYSRERSRSSRERTRSHSEFRNSKKERDVSKYSHPSNMKEKYYKRERHD